MSNPATSELSKEQEWDDQFRTHRPIIQIAPFLGEQAQQILNLGIELFTRGGGRGYDNMNASFMSGASSIYRASPDGSFVNY